MKNKPETIAIIGAGRLGQAIAKGLVASKLYNPSEIILTKRDVSSLEEFESNGYQITSENELAIKKSEVLIFSVGPRDLEALLKSEKNNFSIIPLAVSSSGGSALLSCLYIYCMASSSEFDGSFCNVL